MTTNMQTQLCGSIRRFRPGPSAETATPQLNCGATAEQALLKAGKYDCGNDECSDTDEGLTPEDLMDVLSLYLF